MKRLISIILLTLVLISIPIMSGCIRVDMTEEAGPITTGTYNYTEFTGIEVGHAFEVSITYSDEYSVAITAGENVFEHLNVHKSGGNLVIEIDNWYITWFISPELTVTMPVLTELAMSGASKGTATGFRSHQDMRLHLSGASQLDIDMETGDFFGELSGASVLTGNLISTETELELSGASRVNLTGSGGDITLSGSGASSVDMVDFTVGNTYLEFSGASRGSMTIDGVLDASLSGASLLEYKGNPLLGEVDLSGGSTVRKMD